MNNITEVIMSKSEKISFRINWDYESNRVIEDDNR